MSEVQSVQRTFVILERLAEHGPSGIQQLARDCGLPPATVQRLTRALVTAGLVEQDSDRTYRVTWQLFRWAQAPLARLGLRELAKPFMQELAAEVEETIVLGVRDGDAVLHVEWIPARHLVQPRVRIGERVPLGESSLGRCLLAWPDDPGAEPPPELHRPLATVRELGYALVEDTTAGIRTLAVPIRRGEVSVAAAIGVGGPMNRFSAERAASAVPSLLAVGRAVSAHFGAEPAYGRTRLDGAG
ncbi:IclR family transcriptional regulator [Amycolatopsis rhabdoformis]|uniref:IclR family transcriptional regulator n=1 Tax=Amycolatopsis rhabdoformis TaxID=1448059 RepID=A0ABZ1IGU0_9PSEU|nr:IclR family transcriptional regulator [Amycolatopsis rhabdoformis]WSE33680.1 IclR family transcriptional regulator [Amycolatopsis rhabdoformis]